MRRSNLNLTVLGVVALIMVFVVQPLVQHPWALVALAAIGAITLLLRTYVLIGGQGAPRSERALEGRLVALEEEIKVLDVQQRRLQETVAWQAKLLQQTESQPVPVEAAPQHR